MEGPAQQDPLHDGARPHAGEPSTGSSRSDEEEERRPIEGWRRLGVVVAIVAVWEAIAAGLWLWADLAGIAILAAVVGPVATIVALLRD